MHLGFGVQNVAVGGVANPLALDSQSVLTVERLLAVKEWIDKLDDFVKNVYLVDVAAIGAFYADWTTYGKGIVDYISVPDIPLDGKGATFAMPGGHIANGDVSTFKPITSFNDKYFTEGMGERSTQLQEYTSRSTQQLALEQVKQILMTVPYMQDEVARWRARS